MKCEHEQIYFPKTEPSAAPGNIHASNTGITTLTVAWNPLSQYTKNGIIKGYQ